jgi:hypothetical protein
MDIAVQVQEVKGAHSKLTVSLSKEEVRMSVNQSRRSFLKTTGAVGAGALVAGLGAGLVRPGKAHAALGYMPIDYVNSIDPDEVRRLVWKWYFTGGG